MNIFPSSEDEINGFLKQHHTRFCPMSITLRKDSLWH